MDRFRKPAVGVISLGGSNPPLSACDSGPPTAACSREFLGIHRRIAPPIGHGAGGRVMKRESVSSSVLRAIGYDSSSMTLEVEFTSGDVYQYSLVPEEQYLALMDADSKGTYFNAFIRDRYRGVQV